MKVQVLPTKLANQIAAGEVVERPASVIKELVENSLDAGAKNITIEIRRGGITFMRVTDDGFGMEPEDAKTAFLRHATSKISTYDDLKNVASYGFRGEALAAISSVSNVELITATDAEKPAFYLTLEAGKITSEEEIGAATGTTIIVRDLFFNTPARLHFLKKDSTEAAAVITAIERIAIGRYDVAFTVISDDKVVLKTVNNDDMKGAIHSIYGKNITDGILPVDFEYKGIGISGYICSPNITRANRNMQLTYVNGRIVKSKIIYRGIDDGYRSVRETGKQPVCFLNITTQPNFVDVNVHPSKVEVKFQEDMPIIVAIKYAIVNARTKEIPIVDSAKEAFESFDLQEAQTTDKPVQEEAEQISLDLEKKPIDPEHDARNFVTEPYDPRDVYLGTAVLQPDSELNISETGEVQFMAVYSRDHSLKEGSVVSTDSMYFTRPVSASEHRSATAVATFPQKQRPKRRVYDIPTGMTIHGEAFQTYFLIEYMNTFHFIDKHAAHEKMIYNELVEEVEFKTNISSQTLIQPIDITLTASDVDLVLLNTKVFSLAGFDLHESGADQISLTAVPYVVPQESYIDTFMDILKMIQDKKSESLTDRQDKLFKTIACRAAIKGGSDCKPEEMIPIIKELIGGKDVNYCPHGRPAIFSITKKELDKSFKRIK